MKAVVGLQGPILALLLVGLGSGYAKAAWAEVEEEAETHLRRMSTFLEGLEAFAVSARQTFDTADSATPLSMELNLLVQRPDKLRVESKGDRGEQVVVYDGETFNVSFKNYKTWASLRLPGGIDSMADQLEERFEHPLPLADLLAASPYDSLVFAGTSGRYVGRKEVAGSSCHQLEFTSEAVDWQVCIAAQGDPLPLQFTIVYKQDPGTPRRATVLSAWKLRPKVEPMTFVFKAPEGFEEIRFVAAGEE